MSLIYRTFKWEFISAFVLLGVDSFFRLLFSVFILYLFEAVAEGEHRIAYIYVSVLMVCWYLSQLLKQSSSVITYVLVSRIKTGLAMLLYSKVSKMTSTGIRSAGSGKITNLLANDLSTIEQRVGGLTNCLTFPFIVVGSTAILVARIGWAGIIGIIVMLLIIPLNNCISKKNGELIKEIN
jgi:ABC-type transport system involved in cytochrome bd biosynthesis fused ATPase/permease subunit